MHTAHADEIAMDTATVTGTVADQIMPYARTVPVEHPRARHHLSAILLVVAGGALRLGWLAYARPAPVSDFEHYRRAALAWLDTGVFGVGQPSAWRLPGYPAVLALGATLSRDPVALAAVTAVLSTAQVALTWWVAWRIFGRRRAAATAAAVAAVNPAFVAFAPVLASEHLLAVCVLAALGVAVGPPRRHASRADPSTQRGGAAAALLAGALLGVGTLTRGEALAYVPAVALAVTVGRRPTALRIGAALRPAAVAVVGTVLVVAPWVVRNERVVGPGSGLSTTGGFNFYLAHSPGPYGWRTPLPPVLREPDEVRRNRLGWRHGLHHVRAHPGDWWPTVRTGTVELFAPASYAAHYATVTKDPTSRRLVPRDDLELRPLALTVTGAASQAVLVAGAVGVALARAWRGAGWAATVAVVVGNWLVYAVIFWAQARYRFVVDAMACVAVGAIPATLRSLWQRRSRRRRRVTPSDARATEEIATSDALVRRGWRTPVAMDASSPTEGACTSGRSSPSWRCC